MLRFRLIVVPSLAWALSGCGIAAGYLGVGSRIEEVTGDGTAEISIATDPPGATVQTGGESHGPTPFTIELSHPVTKKRREKSGCGWAALGGLADWTAGTVVGVTTVAQDDESYRWVGISALMYGTFVGGGALTYAAWCHFWGGETLAETPAVREHELVITHEGYETEQARIPVPTAAGALVRLRRPGEAPKPVAITPSGIAAPPLAGPVAALPVSPSGPATAPAAAPAGPALDIPASKVRHDDDVALVIGIEKYRAQLPASDGAEADARTFADVAERALGLARRNVILLTGSDATRSSIEAQLDEWLPKNVKPGSTVYLYFAGHGAPDPKSGHSYLVPWEADPKYIGSQGLRLDGVVERLRRLPSRRVVMVVDACFSGAGGRSVLAAGTRPLVPVGEVHAPRSGEFAILSAAGATEVTGTTKDGRHGLFSWFVLEGLTGRADRDGNGSITLGEVARYAAERTSDEARRDNRDQTPRADFSARAVEAVELVRLR